MSDRTEADVPEVLSNSLLID